MDGARILLFAGSIAAAMLGTLYAGADAERERAAAPAPIAPDPIAPIAPIAPPGTVLAEPIPTGQDIPEALLAMPDADPDEIVDPKTGVRIGPLTFLPRPEPVESTPAPRGETRRAARARRAPRPAPVPRLSPDPGRHVVLVARGMIARGERIQGSCHRYLTEVFDRAGHGNWRTQRVVYRAPREGPYVDLGVIRAGDWLYIVNHPESTPVGTHSVLFVGWQDRARGIAQVIEHPGWGAPRSGQERPYDISRTYRVARPVLSR